MPKDKKIYTVVFNSQISGSASTNNELFFFDWTTIEESRYKVSWSFMSATGANPATLTKVANLFVDLGQGAYTTIASSNNANQGANYSAMYIGSLEVKSITNVAGSLTYYYAGTTTNPPFFIDTRPRQSNIQIMMSSNDANNNTLFTPIPGQYTLTMQFEMID